LKIITLATEGLSDDFAQAKKLADALAREILGENLCLAYYDGERDIKSPSHVECHDCPTQPGYADYAISRGAELRVLINTPRFDFYFMAFVVG